ncbi:MAG: AAA family ATPase, partial [Bdellovibrionales bacterium]|nr:AAA family ATPase [Bdellovibrionales bacterium]
METVESSRDLVDRGILATITKGSSRGGGYDVAFRALAVVDIDPDSVKVTRQGILGRASRIPAFPRTAHTAELAGQVQDLLEETLKQNGLNRLQIYNLGLNNWLPEELAYYAFETLVTTKPRSVSFSRGDVLGARNLDVLLIAVRDELQTKGSDAEKSNTPKRSSSSAGTESKLEIDSLEHGDELRAYISRLEEKKSTMPEHAIKHLKKLLTRFSKLTHAPSEGEHVRKQIDLIMELPWNHNSENVISLEQARIALEKDISGMDDAKEHLLDHLAVQIFSQERSTRITDAPIVCLIGPPGTGKTALAKAVAKAMGMKYMRVALGGVRDETEIRGHRNTYIGATSGRIIEAIKHAGVCDPFVLLDEIDKMGSGPHGDPAAALLEVLDPEQNVEFRDHFLGIPYDLSQVTFFATANYIDNIEPALLDRLEIISVKGYNPDEKIAIATNNLVPRACRKVTLASDQIEINPQVLESII